MALTRDSIRSGAVHKLIAELGIEMRVLSEDELAASLEATLAGVDRAAGVWLFGYGSLIWNPAFHFTDRLVGRIFGYHRRFCLWTHLGRGCPERPGLVLGLERGGSCQGVAYHIAPEAVGEELMIVWRREMLSGAYRPRWVEVRTALGRLPAIAFVINHTHERYAHAARRRGGRRDHRDRTWLPRRLRRLSGQHGRSPRRTRHPRPPARAPAPAGPGADGRTNRRVAGAALDPRRCRDLL